MSNEKELTFEQRVDAFLSAGPFVSPERIEAVRQWGLAKAERIYAEAKPADIFRALGTDGRNVGKALALSKNREEERDAAFYEAAKKADDGKGIA